jgi:large subunit ribosomal protein L23
MRDPYDIIKNVRVTEKATLLSGATNSYTFIVAPDATKIEIKQAIEHIFKKSVKRVNTLHVAGRKTRRGRGGVGRKPDFKKAIVTLKEGETITLA